MVDHIKFPYRSNSHLALMHVIQESESWAKNDLEVDYDWEIDRESAHTKVPTGEVEFVSGNHVSTYAARARGDTWAYLGQTVSWNNIKLVTREDTGINYLNDVRYRKFGSKGKHPGLNTWLYLKQHGLDPDLDQVEIIEEVRGDDGKTNKKNQIEMIKDRDVDAAFLSLPGADFAKMQGLKVIDLNPQPMIYFMTISSSEKMINEHPDIVRRVVKSVIEGIAFFKQNPEKAIDIIVNKHDKEGVLTREQATKLYNDLAPTLEPKLYPSLDAINNIFAEAVRQSKDSAKVHPLALWNFHFIRELDDSGFINDLYKDNPHMLQGHGC